MLRIEDELSNKEIKVSIVNTDIFEIWKNIVIKRYPYKIQIVNFVF